jgi:hypothetical protein
MKIKEWIIDSGSVCEKSLCRKKKQKKICKRKKKDKRVTK